MSQVMSDWISLLGLLVALFGAGITAWAVILRPEDAVNIGVTRWAGETDEENLKLPLVQNLLASSRWAMRGLLLISIGTAFQIVPIVSRLV
ncbi:MAG: hypothetical protein ABJJ90_15120 [Lentilitoribacter sp.]